MKTIFTYLFGAFTIMSFSNCANGKKLQEKAPIAFQQAYYSQESGDNSSEASILKLFIPTNSFEDKKVMLDSAYFRGRQAVLTAGGQSEGLYVAEFEFSGKDRDFVMSSDPKEEYGNKAPILEKIPFDLKGDEAVVLFTKDGKKGYFKLEGIVERESNDGKIKRPENIRH